VLFLLKYLHLRQLSIVAHQILDQIKRANWRETISCKLAVSLVYRPGANSDDIPYARARARTCFARLVVSTNLRFRLLCKLQG
jgi:hypothetical protein